MPPPPPGTPAPPPQSPTPPKIRSILPWLAMLAIGISTLYFINTREPTITTILYSAPSPETPSLVALVEDGKVQKARMIRDMSGTLFIEGQLHEDANIEGLTGKFKTYLPIIDRDTMEWLRANNVETEIPPQNPLLWHILSSLLPVLFVFGLIYFLFIRQMRAAGHGAMSFGKSRARMLNRDRNKITFKNVAGVNEAKEEVQEIIAFLKDPKKFQKLGGRIPKGVMLMGPPGTGKTLLAKAIAGEADVPFFSISGSDFVEMFVGVGASRVRDMFEQGKKNAPCIIFIDEIDAVGRSRFSGIGGGHDEREQTLNALLVEMDGFETSEGVIIIAATNRPDVLDPALLRRGRFDRQIVIDLPMIDGREDILKIHAREIKLGDDVELRRIARGTPGFSGADLENLLNEAALLAARREKDAVGMPDLEEARDKVLWGSERRSRKIDDKEKRLTAYHEAGHAVVQQVVKETEPLHKVTIIPRGIAYLGATMSLPEKDSYTQSRSKLLDELAGAMGGRCAEELVFGEITNGAAQDIKHSTDIARMMVCSWGMSDALGPQRFGQNQEVMFLGREVSRHQDYSELTARKIDAEVARLLREAHQRARAILEEHRDALEAVSLRLLEQETIDGRDVVDLVEVGRIRTQEEREEIDKQLPSADPAPTVDPAAENQPAQAQTTPTQPQET
ncbi:MAG: ATP-dependent zinc metalloprotease FtsH [Kiritimatiellia bacterium]